MKKKYLGILGVCVLVVIAGGVFAWYKGYLGGNRMLARSVQGSPELTALFNKAVTTEEQIKQTPDNQNLYMSAGLTWKSLAEQSAEDKRAPFFKRALATYEAGANKFGQKNILFYYNSAQIATEMGEYGLAEKYYKTTIAISPAEDLAYAALGQLYEYQLKKPVDQVVAVYNDGIKHMVNPASLVWARASYLRRAGKYAEALTDYEALVKNYPDNQGYKDIVAELKAKVANTVNK